jgi:hypothetical protein
LPCIARNAEVPFFLRKKRPPDIRFDIHLQANCFIQRTGIKGTLIQSLREMDEEIEGKTFSTGSYPVAPLLFWRAHQNLEGEQSSAAIKILPPHSIEPP